MKKLFQIVLMSFFVLMSGCALQPQPQKPKVDLSLPTISTIRTLADIKSVALEWTPLYDEKIVGYYLYRGTSGKSLKRVAVIKDRYRSHYIDGNLSPNTLYIYRMSAFTKDGRESKPSEAVEVKTLPIPDSVSFLQAIDHLPKEVKLIWRPHPYLRIDSYIIERSEPNHEKWKQIATIKGRLNVEYLDKNLKDNHIYYYRIKVKTCDGIVSKPSKVVQASTKPRPSVVKGLTATQGLPKKIVLTWLPNPEPDIDHYNVYKSIFSIGPYIVVAKTKSTRYIDLINEDGVKRYYKVTAVDKDGLESFKQDAPAVGSTLSRPLPPMILEKRVENGVLFLRWSSPDRRAVKYIVKKREKLGFLKENEYNFTNIEGTTFSDAGLKPGIKYEYEVIAVDKNGLHSKPSEKIVIEIGEKK